MEHDMHQQPSGPPHDALQRLLHLVLHPYVAAALILLWVLSFLAMLVLFFVSLLFMAFTPAIFAAAMYLLHLWVAVTALILLWSPLKGVVYEHAPQRLGPALRRNMARYASRQPGASWRAAWTGIWLGIYFGACAVLLPWPPLPLTILPSLLVLVATLPIVTVVGCGPSWWYRMSERRRRRASTS